MNTLSLQQQQLAGAQAHNQLPQIQNNLTQDQIAALVEATRGGGHFSRLPTTAGIHLQTEG